MDDKFPYYKDTPGSSKSRRKCRSLGQAQSSVSSSAIGYISFRASKRPRAQPLVQKQQHLPLAVIGQPLVGTPLRLRNVQSCTKCLAKRFVHESRTFCCGDGAVILPSSTYSPELTRLFTSPEPVFVHFRKYARLYNNLFAFNSIGGHFDSQTLKGIYVFKLHGQIYHNVPDLVPQDGQPNYLQLYFYDGQHEAANRTTRFKELDRVVIDLLMNITESNPYVVFFRSLKEVPITNDTQIVIKNNSGQDQRVSNAPTSDEVAAIWSEDSTLGETSGPHILVRTHSEASHSIMHYYGCYDPLQYPLLFPRGECGWHQGLKKNVATDQLASTSTLNESPLTTISAIRNRPASASVEGESLNQTTYTDAGYCTVLGEYTNVEALLESEAHRSSQQKKSEERNVSCREYYCYKLQNRPGNMMLRARRCLQQYIVDMYVKLENTRLDFQRHNQDTIRSELYQGLLDTTDAGEQCAANVGKRIILPATYIGGPRAMKRRYLNAMALVQRYGKPDFFITITCNANWPEIKNELGLGEEPQNRPDIVAGVFRAKLMTLKKKIVEEKIFGEVAAFVYVVEFQKRGLPHAHFLLIMKPDSKMNCPNDFDKSVSAEIPPLTSPNLCRAVLKHMMHGPCGYLDPDCPCMKHKKSLGHCKYAYPKPFVAETTNSVDGYPVYKRSQPSETVEIRDKALKNQWVIPYNPYLMDLYDCHLNVEVCSTIQAVKYLYKYVYKGHDRIAFNVGAAEGEIKPVDEID